MRTLLAWCTRGRCSIWNRKHNLNLPVGSQPGFIMCTVCRFRCIPYWTLFPCVVMLAMFGNRFLSRYIFTNKPTLVSFLHRVQIFPHSNRDCCFGRLDNSPVYSKKFTRFDILELACLTASCEWFSCGYENLKTDNGAAWQLAETPICALVLSFYCFGSVVVLTKAVELVDELYMGPEQASHSF